MSAATVLFTAYPLLPVSDESCGGAEQILCAVEAEMAGRGISTMVAAAAGSRVSGELLTTGEPCTRTDDDARRETEHVAAILDYLANTATPPDLIHDHSGSFWRHAGRFDIPVLATLHLPRSHYPADAFAVIPPNVTFNFVSQAQRREFGALPQAAGVVCNGIAADGLPLREEKDDYLLWMGRICPEKGTHLAIEAAQRCGAPLRIAGDVYPFSWHHKYFQEQVMPHLRDRHSRVFFLGPQTFPDKAHLLRRARGLLLTSLCAETSSLVAMEAMACGTPVIGFRQGAIPEVVEHGTTGFVVDDVEQMVEAVARLGEIRPGDCRQRVLQHFSLKRMADDYQRLYAKILEPKPVVVRAGSQICASAEGPILEPA